MLEALARQSADVHREQRTEYLGFFLSFPKPVTNRVALHVESSIYISPKIKAQQRPSISALPPSHANHVFITQTVE